jgi:hypothetical protein
MCKVRAGTGGGEGAMFGSRPLGEYYGCSSLKHIFLKCPGVRCSSSLTS